MCSKSNKCQLSHILSQFDNNSTIIIQIPPILRNYKTNPKKLPLWEKKHMSHMKLRSNCGGPIWISFVHLRTIVKTKIDVLIDQKSSWLVIHATHSVTHTPFCLFQINVGFREDYKLFLALMLQKNNFLPLKFSLK